MHSCFNRHDNQSQNTGGYVDRVEITIPCDYFEVSEKHVCCPLFFALQPRFDSDGAEVCFGAFKLSAMISKDGFGNHNIFYLYMDLYYIDVQESR